MRNIGMIAMALCALPLRAPDYKTGGLAQPPHRTSIEPSAVDYSSVTMQLAELHDSLVESRNQLFATSQAVRSYPVEEDTPTMPVPYSIDERLGQIRTLAYEVRELSARLSNSIGSQTKG